MAEAIAKDKIVEAKNCKNCNTQLLGKFCHKCGQNSDLHHRSIFHLIIEAFEGLFHFDGRLWRTLPALFFSPGRLNKDFVEGRITRHVPPFRLFLVSLFCLILSSEHGLESIIHNAEISSHSQASHSNSHISSKAVGNNSEEFNFSQFMEGDNDKLIEKVEHSQSSMPWVNDLVVKMLKNPKLYLVQVFTWGHRIAILLLPINAIALTLVYFYKRQFYFYDHLLVSMNMVSFVFFTITISILLPSPYGGIFYGLLWIWTPIYFYKTLRGAYGSSRLSAVLKSIFVCLITTLSFLALLLLIMGLAAYTA